MKTCTKCGKTKPLTEFYKQSGRDGYRGSCIECVAEYGRKHPENKKKYYAKHKERILKYEKDRYKKKRDHVIAVVRAYATSDRGHETRNKHLKDKYPEYKEKISVRRKVMDALKTGKLTRQPCEICGALKVEAHHPDYSKPLEVEWYCSYHHRVIENRVVEPEIKK